MKSLGVVDVMIDLETLGTKPGCVILSIGATTFQPCKEKRLSARASFMDTISMVSCQNVGLTIDPETLKWWSRQSEEAQKEAFAERNTLSSTLIDFNMYLTSLGTISKIRVWGNAASFDIKILEAAYESCGMKIPWKYYNEMCFRTLKNLAPAELEPQRVGHKHSAIDDATHQAVWAERVIDFLQLSWE